MNQQNQEEKLEQNEELANLRADTSIEKTILVKLLPNADSMMPNSRNYVEVETSNSDKILKKS